MCEIMEKLNRETIDSVNRLNVILINQGRTDDLLKAASDPQYQEQLLDKLEQQAENTRLREILIESGINPDE